MTDFTYDSEMRTGRIGGVKIPSVTEIIRPIGYQIQGNFSRGRAVHKAVELLCKGCLNWATVDDSIMGFVLGFEKFVKESGFKARRTEDRLFHPSLMYHGQFDLEGTWAIDEYPQLIDIKTYHPGPETGLQLAGYDLLLPTLKLPRNKTALEVKENGTYTLHYYNDVNDQAAFLALLTIRNWRNSHGIDSNRSIEGQPGKGNTIGVWGYSEPGNSSIQGDIKRGDISEGGGLPPQNQTAS